MEVSFPNVAEIIREFRIWWINAGYAGVLLGGAVVAGCIFLWKLPELLRVILGYRAIRLEHQEKSKVLLERLKKLEEKETARRKVERK